MTDRPDIVFLDIETMGLDPVAPIWEFAAIRREVNGCWCCDTKVEFFIQHDPAHWLDDPNWPDSFKQDYLARFDETAIPEQDAADIIASYVADGAIVHASNPAFDMERIQILLERNKMTPGWDYHPKDIPSLVEGYLSAKGRLPEERWTSNSLSTALGVDPADYARHTALGDCLWTLAQYDIVHGGDE
jgi:DNA polymerase III epsilon subunit-like protein